MDKIDEDGCDIPLSYLLYILASGLVAISLAANIYNLCQRKNRTLDETELENMRPEDQTFEDWHQDESRGKKIAFSQGSDDKRLQNQALIAFEHSFHGNYARAMVCLKVYCIFCCISKNTYVYLFLIRPLWTLLHLPL